MKKYASIVALGFIALIISAFAWVTPELSVIAVLIMAVGLQLCLAVIVKLRVVDSVALSLPTSRPGLLARFREFVSRADKVGDAFVPATLFWLSSLVSFIVFALLIGSSTHDLSILGMVVKAGDPGFGVSLKLGLLSALFGFGVLVAILLLSALVMLVGLIAITIAEHLGQLFRLTDFLQSSRVINFWSCIGFMITLTIAFCTAIRLGLTGL